MSKSRMFKSRNTGIGDTVAVPPFRLSAPALAVVAATGVVALSVALYLRYRVIQDTGFGLACDAGLGTALCVARTAVSVLFENGVFGGVGVVAAALALIRPGAALVTVALAASAFGVVLHNDGLSGLAAALLILCLARPAPAQALAGAPANGRVKPQLKTRVKTRAPAGRA